jgi:hypothetical protein
VIFICTVGGGVSLFLLRKIALKFFVASLVCNVGLTLWQLLSGRLPAGLTIVFGPLLMLAIILYTVNLRKKQIIM